MQVCRHCGWDNPEIAAFCTNCGTGLGRDRSGGPRFRALGLTSGRHGDAGGQPDTEWPDTEWPAAATPGGSAARAPAQSVLSQTLVDFSAPPLDEAAPQPLRTRPASEPPRGERPQRTEQLVSPMARRAPDALVTAPHTGGHAPIQRRSTGPMLMPDEADISVDLAADTQVMKTVTPSTAPADDAYARAPDPDEHDTVESAAVDDDDEPAALDDAAPAAAEPDDVDDIDDAPSDDPPASDDDATATTDPPVPAEPEDSLEEDGFDEFVDPGQRANDSLEQDDEVISSIDEPGGSGEVEIEAPDADRDAPRADDSLADAIDAFARDGDVRIAPPSDSPFEAEDELELSTSDLHAVDFGASDPPQPLTTSPSLRAVPPPLPPADIPRYVLRPFSQTLGDRKIVPVGDTPLTIGREDTDIRVSDDLFVSPKHARFAVRDSALWVEDLGSLNGVWRRVRTDALLQSGDQLLIGQQVLRVEASPGRLNGVPPADGTQRLGPPAERSRYRVLQIAADGEPLDVYHVPAAGCRLGRRLGDLVFTDDTYMSGTHALLVPEDGHLKICDLSSRNGCWVRLRDRAALQVGDAVMIGRTVWRIGRPV